MGVRALIRGLCSWGVLCGVIFGLQAQASKKVERVKPYPNYQSYRQRWNDKVCWALAAKSILLQMQNLTAPVCEVVGETLNENCCSSGNRVESSCNRIGYVDRALANYNAKFYVGVSNFQQAFETLKNGGLVAIIMDLNNSSFGDRVGHVAVIYAADRYSDGHYAFYVGDSVNGNFKFKTADMKKLKNGNYQYLSYLVSFQLEEMVHVHKGRR